MSDEPRTCVTCIHWEGSPDEWSETALCLILSDNPSFTPDERYDVETEEAFVAPFAGADGGGLRTKATFGCTLHAARSATQESETR